MKVAIEGCAHGDIEKIYNTIQHIEKEQNFTIDLLIICGDFQAVRNESDLQTMACPQKYRDMHTFYKYYSGEKVAPVLTVFIGGNHEASNHLQELYYGGWVAPNIYYLGASGVVRFGGLRISGLSGIYKQHDFYKSHFEIPPYDNSTMRSIYHVREIEILKLSLLSRMNGTNQLLETTAMDKVTSETSETLGKPDNSQKKENPVTQSNDNQPISEHNNLSQTEQFCDIFLSHDWPQGITKYGNEQELLRKKKFLASEIRNNTFGSPPAAYLLATLKPKFWFSAHMHVKFPALVYHDPPQQTSQEDTIKSKTTKFLALDKCLPRREFLQIVDIPTNDCKEPALQYDLDWLAITKATHHLVSNKYMNSQLPTKETFQELDAMKQQILQNLKSLDIPKNFYRTCTPYDPSDVKRSVRQDDQKGHPFTDQFLNLIGEKHTGVTIPVAPSVPATVEDPDQIDIDDI